MIDKQFILVFYCNIVLHFTSEKNHLLVLNLLTLMSRCLRETAVRK